MFKRVLTAILGIPIVFFVVVKGGSLFNLLAFVIAITAFYEYSRITKLKDKFILISAYFLAGLIIFANFDIMPLTILYLFIGAIYIRVINFSETALKDLGILSWGIIYIYLPLYMLTELRGLQQGTSIIFFLLVITWLTDSGAYFVGMSFGKNKLAEKISPKKTIEGSIGGTIIAIIGALVYTHFFLSGESYLALGIFTFIGSLFSQVGDLFESAIKREYNVKDSGNVLPGHGGILDRIDSLLFLVPLSYVFFMYIL